MKKLLVLTLALAMIFALAACGGKEYVTSSLSPLEEDKNITLSVDILNRSTVAAKLTNESDEAIYIVTEHDFSFSVLRDGEWQYLKPPEVNVSPIWISPPIEPGETVEDTVSVTGWVGQMRKGERYRVASVFCADRDSAAENSSENRYHVSCEFVYE